MGDPVEKRDEGEIGRLKHYVTDELWCHHAN